MVNERLERIFKELTKENQDTLILVAKGMEVAEKNGKVEK